MTNLDHILLKLEALLALATHEPAISAGHLANLRRLQADLEAAQKKEEPTHA